MSILLALGTVVLIFTSIVLIFLVLMQKAKSDGGLGAAMGGGMAEATFGADTSNVLSRGTINASIVFFILSFALYLGRVYEGKHASASSGGLPTITVAPSAASTPAHVAIPAAISPSPTPAQKP